MTKRRLTEIALMDARWEDDARWAVHGNWDLHMIAEEEAAKLRTQIVNRELNLKELRAGVAWANALDRESVEVYGSDLSIGEQKAERAARRLMHIAGRSALDGVRNERLRSLVHVANRSGGQMPGMGGLETNDRKDTDLVQ